MNRYFEILKQYVISGGQVSRRESRIFTLLALIAGFLLGFVGIFVGYSGFIMAYFILGGCVLSMLIPSIAISVSVLNDANRSGWWLLISFIPLIGSMFYQSVCSMMPIAVGGGCLSALFRSSMILLGFTAQDSQSNENQSGCNPENAAV